VPEIPLTAPPPCPCICHMGPDPRPVVHSRACCPAWNGDLDGPTGDSQPHIEERVRREEHRRFAEWLHAVGYPFDWTTEKSAPVPPEVLAEVWREREPRGDGESMEHWTLLVREEGGWDRA
jgi:hypothetical protein